MNRNLDFPFPKINRFLCLTSEKVGEKRECGKSSRWGDLRGGEEVFEPFLSFLWCLYCLMSIVEDGILRECTEHVIVLRNG